MSEALARKERLVLNLLYGMGEGTAAEIQEALADGSSYSAVRGMLRVMEEKGLVTHRSQGSKYIFAPTQRKEEAAKSALKGLAQVFFGGRIDEMVATLLTDEDQGISKEELDRLSSMIEEARREGK